MLLRDEFGRIRQPSPADIEREKRLHQLRTKEAEGMKDVTPKHKLEN